MCLAAELAFGTDFARHARHFGGKGVQLVHHRVDGVLQFKNFAFHVDGDLLRQVATRHRCRHLGDVADLCRQVASHRVDAVGQILPSTGNARHVGLPAEPAFGADFARHARHLAGEAVELVDHRVQRFLQLKDLAAHVDRNLARQVAPGDRRGDFRNVTHLGGQIAGHGVDAIGQVFPGTGDAWHLRLPAELALGADLARHARDFGGEGVELIDHGVEGVFQLENLTTHVDRDLARQVAPRHRCGDFGDVANLPRKVRGH